MFSRRKNGFYPERISTVYTRYKRPGDFDVLSSTMRDLKMVQQETRKLDGQCVDFCDILKDRCCFFFTDRLDAKTVRWNVQKNYSRTATRAVSTDCLWDFFLSLLHCLSICL